MVELLVYMGLFAIILIPLMQLFGSIIEVRLESEATSAVAEDGVYILTRLTNDLHKATNLTTTATKLTISGNGTSYVYALNGQDLRLTDNNIAPPNNSFHLNSANTTVSNLSFATISTNTVNISFRLTSTIIRSGGKPQIEDFSTTIGIR